MIHVVVDDLAFLDADAIVRPTNARLDATTTAVRRIEQVGGSDFLARIKLRRELAVGAAVVTGGGGDLPAEFVIHAVIQSDTQAISREGVARAWLSALQRAQEWGFGRLSAPPLGIGAGNLTVEDAAELMVSVLRQHRATAGQPAEVHIVVERTEDREVFEAAIKRQSAGDS